jgi:hypothetical protein
LLRDTVETLLQETARGPRRSVLLRVFLAAAVHAVKMWADVGINRHFWPADAASSACGAASYRHVLEISVGWNSNGETHHLAARWHDVSEKPTRFS